MFTEFSRFQHYVIKRNAYQRRKLDKGYIPRPMKVISVGKP